MKVPYQLRWLDAMEPATAWLVPGHDADAVLRVSAQVGTDAWPIVHTLKDGFLIRLPGPSSKQILGVIRLRGVSENLLIPVNAELIPPLLADEASALVRQRGLVFLPGGRVLEFNPANPIPLAAFLRLDGVKRRPWEALPTFDGPVDRIGEITLAGGDMAVDDVFAEGGEGIGSESPDVDQPTSMPKQIAGGAMFQLGKSLAWLGQKLNSAKLANLGAKLLGGAMALAPALSQQLMGAQEAMLRKLLQQFRDGDIDDALKHALPLNADPGRGAGFAGNAHLPTHSLFYSLVDLLGKAGGAGSMWMTADQTYWELMAEYRKQAEAAVRKGDFRRAAYIYAKLLNDFHSAAKALAQGGLHRDAAILYEKKLLDFLSAAKQWEAAGDPDRAVQLYRQIGDHAAAGDLLRRIGEEERAVAEYAIAARKLVEGGPKHFEAGELLRTRGQRPDLARAYYEQGWQARPAGQAIQCATRLVQDHAEKGESDSFVAVLSEAESLLVSCDGDTTATFMTEIARLAKTPPLEPIADDIHDRALVGIARKMKQTLEESGPMRNLPHLFKNTVVWPTPLIGDAQFAVKEASRRPAPSHTKLVTVQAGHSTVTAVCQVPITGTVFIGFENGVIMSFPPGANTALGVTREGGPIQALTMDAAGLYLLALSQRGPDKVCLSAFSREFGYRMNDYTILSAQGPMQLGVPALNSPCSIVVLADGQEYRMLGLPGLGGIGNEPIFEFEETPDLIVYGRGLVRGSQAQTWILAVQSGTSYLLTGSMSKPHRCSLEWRPAIGEHSTLLHAQVQAIFREPASIELTGIDHRGRLCRSVIPFNTFGAETSVYTPQGEDRYRAFACVRTDLFAAVNVEGIDWWTPSRTRPVRTRLHLRNPVAAFVLPSSHELLIVETDGLLTRVPIAE